MRTVLSRMPTDDPAMPETHTGRVVQYSNDARRDRILRAEYEPRDFPHPADRITVQACSLALSDPWACDWSEYSNRLYISDRANARIVELDVDTGEGRPLVAGDVGVARVVSGEPAHRVGTLEDARAQPCLAPEGIRCHGEWVYWGSAVQLEVRRVSLATGAVETVCKLEQGGTKYVQLDVSDDTCYPEGSVAVADWHSGGQPWLYLPDGTRHPVYGLEKGIPGGPGGAWDAVGYASAVSIRRGRLTFGASTEGLYTLSRTRADDAPMDREAVLRGWDEWYRSGLHLAYGDRGFCWHRRPLPDVSDDVRAYLDACDR
jgi:hypothetical protein